MKIEELKKKKLEQMKNSVYFDEKEDILKEAIDTAVQIEQNRYKSAIQVIKNEIERMEKKLSIHTSEESQLHYKTKIRWFTNCLRIIELNYDSYGATPEEFWKLINEAPENRTPAPEKEGKKEVTVSDIQYFVEKSMYDLGDIMRTSEDETLKKDVLAQLELLTAIKETFFSTPAAEKVASQEKEYCEWEITDSRIETRYLTECGYTTTFMNETNICSYCNKPIKVKEE